MGLPRYLACQSMSSEYGMAAAKITLHSTFVAVSIVDYNTD